MAERLCQVCGRKVSVCRNKLDFVPRGGLTYSESRLKRAPGLLDHVENTRIANNYKGKDVPEKRV